MVTSSAIALIAINDRVGRCTRLATTILFIISAWVPHPSRALCERVGILSSQAQPNAEPKVPSTEYWPTSSPAASPDSTADAPDAPPPLPSAAPTQTDHPSAAC